MKRYCRKGLHLKKRTEISVIVPIYKGEKYIAGMIEQVETAAREAGAFVELIFVNDDPDVRLEQMNSEVISINVLNTDKNRGIHASRVKGMLASAGEYIVFLDQDDLIRAGYFSDQLKSLSGKDAVVCSLKNGNKNVYSDTYSLDKMMNLNYFLCSKNPIVSPGQVLIKRKSIPAAWAENILTSNGADDWFLWIAMLADGCSFGISCNIDFEHVIHEGNCSWHEEEMSASEYAMYHILRDEKLLSQDELDVLQRNLEERNRLRISDSDKRLKVIRLYQKWIELYKSDDSIAEMLIRAGYHKIAIYGAGEVGHRLYDDLKATGVRVMYFIDRDAKLINENIMVYSPQDDLPAVDIIVIATVSQEKVISDIIDERVGKNAVRCTISELLINRKMNCIID